jgi:20S proteasome subunit alpha 1
MMSIDDEKGPQVFKLDPAGHCEGYRGCTSGTKEQEAMTLLEKAYKKKSVTNSTFSPDEATEAVIDVLQNVIGADFKATDIEVGIVTTADPNFRVLPVPEVEKFLNLIADKS